MSVPTIPDGWGGGGGGGGGSLTVSKEIPARSVRGGGNVTPDSVQNSIIITFICDSANESFCQTFKIKYFTIPHPSFFLPAHIDPSELNLKPPVS